MAELKSPMNVLAPAPIRTPLVDSNGALSQPWVLYFQKLNTRVGGSYSQTVNQITETITNITNSTIAADVSTDGIPGIEGLDTIEDITRLAGLCLPSVREVDDVIPEIHQSFDYDNGIWTPAFTGITTTGTVVTTAKWTKIGNQFFWDITIDASAGTATCAAGSLSNLPYSCVGFSPFIIWPATSTTLQPGYTNGSSAFFTDFTITSGIVMISGRFNWQ